MFKKILDLGYRDGAFVDEAVEARIGRTNVLPNCTDLIFTIASLSLHIEPDQPVDEQATSDAVDDLRTFLLRTLIVLVERWTAGFRRSWNALSGQSSELWHTA
ncbi:hypothetical protein HDF16_005619 [Granulicella aggregans]|uniref:Uncharacterized protein n=1 Tax=Granulicella aggregans TaxID=474949 RepID=A0A7W7ZJH7_9BACT|nr:hypothetical protein [Granulicella aggregans]